jgi:hypothetical protein
MSQQRKQLYARQVYLNQQTEDYLRGAVKSLERQMDKLTRGYNRDMSSLHGRRDEIYEELANREAGQAKEDKVMPL